MILIPLSRLSRIGKRPEAGHHPARHRRQIRNLTAIEQAREIRESLQLAPASSSRSRRGKVDLFLQSGSNLFVTSCFEPSLKVCGKRTHRKMPKAPLLRFVQQIQPQNTDIKAAVGWGVTGALAALWLIQVRILKSAGLSSARDPSQFQQSGRHSFGRFRFVRCVC